MSGDRFEVDAYELVFKGFLPSFGAIEFWTLGLTDSRKFITPTSTVFVLAERRLIDVQHGTTFEIYLAVTLPRWKAKYGNAQLDPDRDCIEHLTADDRFKHKLEAGTHRIEARMINLPATEYKP